MMNPGSLLAVLVAEAEHDARNAIKRLERLAKLAAAADKDRMVDWRMQEVRERVTAAEKAIRDLATLGVSWAWNTKD